MPLPGALSWMDEEGRGDIAPLASNRLDRGRGGGSDALQKEMADVFSREKRSEIMSQIRSRDTKPELLLRSALHRAGLRFTVNGPLNRELPGRPDIVLPRYGAVVLVHGCYWHRHKGCKLAYQPKTRVKWWNAKFKANVERDRLVSGRLRRLGWSVYTVWECQIRMSPEEAARRVARKLGCG